MCTAKTPLFLAMLLLQLEVYLSSNNATSQHSTSSNSSSSGDEAGGDAGGGQAVS